MIPRSARDLEQSTPNERPFMKFVSRTNPMAVPHQIHTYAELRQQIHDDLRIKYPEWVEPNGESSMCLMEVLDTLTRRGSNESIATPHRAFEQDFPLKLGMNLQQRRLLILRLRVITISTPARLNGRINSRYA